MTDISDLDWTPAQLKTYIDRVLADRDAVYTERDRRYTELRQADLLAVTKADDSASEAIHTAKTEASDRLAAHNGLLDKMEKQAGTFALRETTDERLERLANWQAKITGGMILLGAIGLSNLVKVWLT